MVLGDPDSGTVNTLLPSVYDSVAALTNRGFRTAPNVLNVVG